MQGRAMHTAYERHAPASPSMRAKTSMRNERKNIPCGRCHAHACTSMRKESERVACGWCRWGSRGSPTAVMNAPAPL